MKSWKIFGNGEKDELMVYGGLKYFLCICFYLVFKIVMGNN